MRLLKIKKFSPVAGRRGIQGDLKFKMDLTKDRFIAELVEGVVTERLCK